jgi:hypothetical protein
MSSADLASRNNSTSCTVEDKPHFPRSRNGVVQPEVPGQPCQTQPRPADGAGEDPAQRRRYGLIEGFLVKTGPDLTPFLQPSSLKIFSPPAISDDCLTQLRGTYRYQFATEQNRLRAARFSAQ